MDVRSLRLLLGWSREDLAKRSGVPIASVYLIERMGTAGPEDDGLMIRVLLADRKSKSLKRLLVNEFSPTEPANDVSLAAPASELHASSQPEASRHTAQRCDGIDEPRVLQGACPGVPATC
ncbi:MAG: XRE family transcriptional regulator [Oxalobacteraceae bacterium]|nr:MAG: XRE family transcriptional regulator [Oxalobacteraceae bacterium]